MISGDRPPVDPLRVVRLTPGQLRRILTQLDRRWAYLDYERRAMSPSEGQVLIGEQQEIEAIQTVLRRAL